MKQTVISLGLALAGAALFFSISSRDSHPADSVGSLADADRALHINQNLPAMNAPSTAHERASRRDSELPTAAARASTATSLPIPDAPEPTEKRPAETSLWQTPQAGAVTTLDGIPGFRVQVDPDTLRQFHVGQTVILALDEIGTELSAELTSTYNDDHGVKIWHGALTDVPPGSGLVIAQGAMETHLIITSPSGTYSAVIDNATGAATLIDEGQILAGQASFDDAIPVSPLADATPPQLD